MMYLLFGENDEKLENTENIKSRRASYMNLNI